MNRKYLNLMFVLSAILLMAGCASQPKALYMYGDYSSRYYMSKKEPTQQSALELQKSIEYAIENAGQSSSNRVAPGMYANLGYIYLKSGNNQKAIENFEKEKAAYPESTHFMNRMIQKIKVSEGANK